MALLGLKLSVPVPVRPNGWTPSVTDTFSDYQYSTVSKVFSVLKSNTSGADEAAVMDSILNTPTTGLIAQIETWLGSLEISVSDVDYWVLIKGLTNNVDPNNGDSDFFLGAPETFKITVVVYLKPSILP